MLSMMQNAKNTHSVMPEVDQRLHVLGEQEQVLGHVDLGEDGCVAHQGHHALGRGFVEVGVHQVAAEQERGVVLDVAAEEVGEHQAHHQQHQKGRQHAPQHAQHRPLVFFLEVPLHQLFKQEAVTCIFFQHVYSVGHRNFGVADCLRSPQKVEVIVSLFTKKVKRCAVIR